MERVVPFKEGICIEAKDDPIEQLANSFLCKTLRNRVNKIATVVMAGLVGLLCVVAAVMWGHQRANERWIAIFNAKQSSFEVSLALAGDRLATGDARIAALEARVSQLLESKN